jgi:transglutaminase-like putative cysteine protease
LLAGLFTILSSAGLRAQPLEAAGRPDMTFGAITPENFTGSSDSSAHAIYLFDRGQVVFDDTYRRGAFGSVFEKHTRILILHKSAFSLATLTLSNYRKADAIIEDFKGATYNLENGNVIASKLDKSNIFKDKNPNFEIEKIAFPNVKEGSIIEYSYRILYPNLFLPPWVFQGAYPELWSEYDITVPRLFDYAVKMQGYQKFTIDTTIAYNNNAPGLQYGVSDRSFYANQAVRRIWVLQNVPPLEKPEPYTTTLKNHIAKIEFQLSAARRSNGYTETFSTTWPQLTAQLLKEDNFGAALDDHNRWLDDDLKKITAGISAKPELIRPIYAYLRDHFTVTPVERIYTSQPVKKTWEEKKGNIADINLLLVAIYRHLGLDAAPVILSTRSNGYTHDGYPMLGEYNYVIARVRADGTDYLLDASRPNIGFGQLPEICYNGWARVIDSTHDRIPLMADSAKENRHTIVILTNTDSGYSGTYTRTAGLFESMSLRNQLKKTRPEDFFENLRKTMADFKQMGEHGFDSLDVPEARVTWFYNMKFRFGQKRVYLNPVMHERFNVSPFIPEERHYPVEMPFCIDNSYVLNMEVPTGYAVDQLPASQRILMDDSSGFFEYKISQDGNTINFHVALRLNKAVYPLEEYAGLRKFFSLIANKEKEQIIFKKIN